MSVRGDAHNHFSRGHICPKGNALQDVHHDPERLRFPLRRGADGWERVGWDEALDDIAARVLAIQREHGRDAVGVYAGNPTVHHLGAMLMMGPLFAALGTRNRFSATSLDQLPHMLAAWKLFGHQLLLPVPDIDRTQFFLLPRRQPDGLQRQPDDRARHPPPAARAAGPRRPARGRRSAAHGDRRDRRRAPLHPAGHRRAGCCSRCCRCSSRKGTLRAAAFVDGLDELAGHVEDFTPERAAEITGIPADDIRRLARDLAAAPRAVVYGRLGLCTQEFGALSAWLVYVLNIVTGNLDREGGAMFSTPAVDPLPLAAATGFQGSFDRYRSRVSGLPEFAGELPTAALAEEIDTPGEGQIRALIVHAGNPVLSAPNGPRLARALPGAGPAGLHRPLPQRDHPPRALHPAAGRPAGKRGVRPRVQPAGGPQRRPLLAAAVRAAAGRAPRLAGAVRAHHPADGGAWRARPDRRRGLPDRRQAARRRRTAGPDAPGGAVRAHRPRAARGRAAHRAHAEDA